jgi:hypothetical protein
LIENDSQKTSVSGNSQGGTVIIRSTETIDYPAKPFYIPKLYDWETNAYYSLLGGECHQECDMDHVVYVDAKAKELSGIMTGKKTMIIRGAAGRKMPYGRVNSKDVLYLIENDGSGLVRARAKVITVLNSEKMTKDASVSLVEEHQDKLQLTSKQFKRWAGKRYLVLIEIEDIEKLEPFSIDKSEYGNMDDWLPVGNIKEVKVSN